MTKGEQEGGRLWTADEVAARWGVSKWSVYDRARRGEIPSVRLGPRCIRFLPSRILEFEAAGGWCGESAGSGT